MLPLDSDVESGYASASSSQENLQTIMFTPAHLKFINKQLSTLEPQGTVGESGMVEKHC